ncbi:Na+/H+ antiporter subunit E [Saccharibacillus sp. CPCC 101409]|uniref:Na+/H+ antiporter subunit E n=1 Tax=Saccharibacillus sp. CPCC 101409 TaxID=3058041 RepID=UPI002673F85D|nr:Na+/H+ antiporter subunit E [Saccharibacillus sp. CPCC 101409]MDO3410226.1 Na+/H+ antiporter subunit E [Saccharibacillus sp. CPCC 101409]
MAFQLLLNIVIAFVWMLLMREMTVSGFIVGFLIGLLLMSLMRRFFPKPFYPRKVWSCLKLLLLLLKELVVSSSAVIRQILKPKLDMTPGIFAYETKLNPGWELTLLCGLVNLTPGTLLLEVDPEENMLYIHAMHIEEAHGVEKHIRSTFERAIMEVTRS